MPFRVVQVMGDVFGGPDKIVVYGNSIPYNSLLLEDARFQDEGSFQVVLENQGGVPYLHVWKSEHYDDDPTWTIKLRPDDHVRGCPMVTSGFENMDPDCECEPGIPGRE